MNVCARISASYSQYLHTHEWREKYEKKTFIFIFRIAYTLCGICFCVRRSNEFMNHTQFLRTMSNRVTLFSCAHVFLCTHRNIMNAVCVLCASGWMDIVICPKERAATPLHCIIIVFAARDTQPIIIGLLEGFCRATYANTKNLTCSFAASHQPPSSTHTPYFYSFLIYIYFLREKLCAARESRKWAIWARKTQPNQR